MNVFICTTRLYKDAEQRFTQSGDSVVSFTGAVDAGFGEKKTTSWIKFNLWGKRGESLVQHLKDKTQVCVSGELANRKWTDKDGQDKFSLEVRVNDITLVGGKPEGGNQGNQPRQQQGNSKPQSKSSQSFDDLENDIPF